ncbi:MAG: hypothetical protein ACTHYN_16005 [Marinobacter sp.]|uniref:hypothetical protein n=1 Tax=Gammaproteobacteria TaxID=1236 RepID=UPI003F955953
MNLNTSPTKSQLEALISACDDSAGHHVVWVDKNGDVSIDVVPQGLTPIGFEQSKPSMLMRYETFSCGNDYVGPSAAKDTAHIAEIFESLVKEWLKVRTDG